MRNKKSWKRLAALVLSTVMLVPAQAAYATEGQEGETEMEAYAESRATDADGFEIEDGVLKKYTGTATEVVIPEGVTVIGHNAFSECNSVTSIMVPNGVTNIEYCAFEKCGNLLSIMLPDSVTDIGAAAFHECKNLTSVVIPPNVTEIFWSTFAGCENLASVTLPHGLVHIWHSAFDGCTNLSDINLPDSLTDIDYWVFYDCSSLKSLTIPKSMTAINFRVFQHCTGLTSVTIPDNINVIGEFAFADCSNLTDVTISEGVADIGEFVFSGCSSLTKIKVEDGNAVYDSRGNCNAIIETASNTLIAGCKNTIIPESVTNIGARAFQGCSSLIGISIPEGVKDIGNGAFIGCENLIEINIPEGVTSIASNAFFNCNANLVIYGKTGSYAETYAKENNIKFSSTGVASNPIGKKTISSNNVSLSQTSYTYDGKAKTPTVIVKDGSKTLVENADYTVAYSNNVNVGTAEVTVTGKGNYSGTVTKKFTIKEAPTPGQKVKKLSKCTITVSQTSYTYDGRAKKPTVTVKDGSKTLVENTDYTVTYNNNINAGTAKVTVTGKGNYEGTVTKTFTIIIKKGTSYKAGSFQYKVTGTSTVSMIGVKDSKTTKVKVPKTVKIGGKLFKVTAIGSSAFKNNKKITSIEIGDNVKSIGTSAFEGCIGLTKVTVGKGVTEIGGSAFKDCKKLGTITIKSNNLKKVGKNALKGIKATAKIKVPAKKLPAYKKLFKNKGQGRKVKIVK